tara:strand:+ start:162 stop:470 length:309 start_codon:yes stop_codon:yes gene_type:complete
MTQKKYYVDYYFAKDAIWKTDSNGEKQLDGYNTRSRYFVRLGNAINFYEKIMKHSDIVNAEVWDDDREVQWHPVDDKPGYWEISQTDRDRLKKFRQEMEMEA